MTNTAAAAAEYSRNIGPDFTLADALDPEYLEEAPERTEDTAPLVTPSANDRGERVGHFRI